MTDKPDFEKEAIQLLLKLNAFDEFGETSEALRAAYEKGVREEREACAKACDDVASAWAFHSVAPSAANACRDAIRSRPAPATDALERALRACAEYVVDYGAVASVMKRRVVEAAIAAGKAAL